MNMGTNSLCPLLFFLECIFSDHYLPSIFSSSFLFSKILMDRKCALEIRHLIGNQFLVPHYWAQMSLALEAVTNHSIDQQKQWHSAVCFACFCFIIVLLQLGSSRAKPLFYSDLAAINVSASRWNEKWSTVSNIKHLTWFYFELHLGTIFHPEAPRNFFPFFVLVY